MIYSLYLDSVLVGLQDPESAAVRDGAGKEPVGAVGGRGGHHGGAQH